MSNPTQPSASNKPFRILSLDGGGAKGFYTLGLLYEIEAMTKKPICQTFDLIYGTSTGSIIAALLARGESVQKVHDLYKQHVPFIMKSERAEQRTQALHALAKTVFQEETCDVFKTRIGIVTTNWKEERPMIFKINVAQAHGSTGSFQPFFGCKVADAVIGSCSAYPLFHRHTITTSAGSIIELADGGFCANNPTLYAIADATLALKIPSENIRLVSLGVGHYPEPSLVKKVVRLAKDWKLFRHAPGSDFMQKILGTNTKSMEVLSSILYKSIPTIRISDAFVEPDMATDLLEHDLTKLNRLYHKGRTSFSSRESDLHKFLL